MIASRLLPVATLLLVGCSVQRPDGGNATVASEIVDLVAPDTLSAPDVGAVRVDDDLLREGRSLTDWPALAFNYAQQRFSPLGLLTPDTARGLAVAWTAPLEGQDGAVLSGPVATPIVAGDILYATGAGGWVRAFDVRTGELIWRGDPDAPTEGASTPPPGAALWKGRLFVARPGGVLASYDAKSGRLLWHHQVGAKGDAITSTPLVADNLLFVGTQRGGRGAVAAFDYNDGAERWRFWTTPSADGGPDEAVSDPALAQVSATWGDARPAALPGTDPAAPAASPPPRGGAIVGSLAYDPVSDRLILGTGAARVTPPIAGAPPAVAPARLFSRSLIAIGARQGTFAWARQLPGSGDASRAIVLARLPLGTGLAPVAMTVTSAGELATVALADGALVGWFPSPSLRDEAPSRRATAFELAAAASYSPDAGLLFVPRTGPPAPPLPPRTPAERQARARGDLPPAAPALASLTAIDPITGAARWSVAQTGERSGVLSTAGGLVFQGSAGGRLTAYALATGRAVWSAAFGGPVLSPPSSFLSDGHQAIAFAVSGAPARLVLLRGPPVAAQQTP